jgi:hypothetical protein
VAETLATFFKQFIVYQPSGRKLPSEMQSWFEANVMEIRVPVQTKDEILVKVAKEFQSFAGLHNNGKNLKTAVFGGQQGGMPHFGEFAVSRIISDVKKSRRSESAEVDFDPLFSAQVFLDFAQKFDRQRAEINRELGESEQHSLNLFKEIRGEKENGLPATPLSAGIQVEDPAEYMALDRLNAWIRLFMSGPVDSGLLITSSPAVFNHLIENLTASQQVIQAESLPVTDANDAAVVSWRDSLLKRMKQLIESRGGPGEHTFGDVSLPQGQRSNVRLTLYLVPGKGASNIFARIFDDKTFDTRRSDQKAEFGNTLIGLIDR